MRDAEGMKGWGRKPENTPVAPGGVGEKAGLKTKRYFIILMQVEGKT